LLLHDILFLLRLFSLFPVSFLLFHLFSASVPVGYNLPATVSVPVLIPVGKGTALGSITKHKSKRLRNQNAAAPPFTSATEIVIKSVEGVDNIHVLQEKRITKFSHEVRLMMVLLVRSAISSLLFLLEKVF
jgi:hypothetical protein